jgi:BirA family biotin operon repressor/biotin-[acetyl-CoA-carboxylase] ligase
MLVWADEQTAGRGRGSKSWWSGVGSVTFSLALSRNGLSLEPQSLYSLAVALAVRASIREFVAEDRLALKWPNDVLLDGRKLGGILLETAGSAGNVLVIGIGLNVNNALAQAPPDVRSRAISLVEATGHSVEPSRLVGVLLPALQALIIAKPRSAEIVRVFRRYNFLKGKQISVVHNNSALRGKCIDLDETGALVVDTEQGRRSLSTGTVEVVDDPMRANDSIA